MSANAERLFGQPLVIHVPDLCCLEVAHVLQRKVRRKELDQATAISLYDIYSQVGKNFCSPIYLEFEEHFTTGITPYDQIYLNASASVNAPLISSDHRLIRHGAIPLASF